MVRVSQRQAVMLAAALLFSSVAYAQTAPTNAPVPPITPTDAAPPVNPLPPVGPATDLAPMPDLGVDWPDPAKIDAAPAVNEPTEVKGIAADKPQHYRVVLEGA